MSNPMSKLRASFRKSIKRSKSTEINSRDIIKEPLYDPTRVDLDHDHNEENEKEQQFYLDVPETHPRSLSKSKSDDEVVKKNSSVQPLPPANGSLQKFKQRIRQSSQSISKLFKKKFNKNHTSNKKQKMINDHDRSYSEVKLFDDSHNKSIDESDGNVVVIESTESGTFEARDRRISQSEGSLTCNNNQLDEVEYEFMKNRFEKPSLSSQIRRSFRKIADRNKSMNKYRGFRNESNATTMSATVEVQ